MEQNRALGWKLEIDSVGDLCKMVINLHSDALCVSVPQFAKNKYDRFLNEIPMPVSYTHLTLPTIYSV